MVRLAERKSGKNRPDQKEEDACSVTFENHKNYLCSDEYTNIPINNSFYNLIVRHLLPVCIPVHPRNPCSEKSPHPNL